MAVTFLTNEDKAILDQDIAQLSETIVAYIKCIIETLTHSFNIACCMDLT